MSVIAHQPRSSVRMYPTPEYESFRASIPQRKVLVDEYSKPWICYEAGPKTVTAPIILLPPVCGQADCYYKQLLSMPTKGYRLIALEWPPYWTVREFCEGMLKVMDALEIKSAHFFGASLGGYLATRFAEMNHSCQRVLSLLLCNSFVDTRIFARQNTALLYWALPSMILKRLILGGFPTSPMDPEIVESIDFMVESLDSLRHSELASRLTLNCAPSQCTPTKIRYIPTTIMDVFDECALSTRARDDMRKAFPSAKRAHLKTGGNFPFISRCAEVNMHIQVHLRLFDNSVMSAKDESSCSSP